jgi:hypothetical protein
MGSLSRAYRLRKKASPQGVRSDQHRHATIAKTREEWLEDPSRTDLPFFDQKRPKPKGKAKAKAETKDKPEKTE